MTVRVIPVISDLQVPLHDKRATSAVATWIADQRFTQVACVGDVLDSTQISRWTRGTAGEHAGSLAKDRDLAVKVMRDLRITDLSRSNHDDRIENYVRQYGPGLATLPELRIETFLGLDDLHITFHRKPMAIAPGWLMMHGDESGYSRTAGGTALGLARKTGRSVVCGHTHKLGLQHDHASFGGRRVRNTWGFEVGNLMDARRAGYLKAGISNWQQGVGVLVVDGNDVTPIPIPIRPNGSLYFDGKTYKP